MRTSILILILFLFSFRASSQVQRTSELLDTEQRSFLQYLNSIYIDVNIATRMLRFGIEEADSIQKSILNNKRLDEVTKIKALNSVMYFIDGIKENLGLPKAELYDIPSAMESYKQVLNALLENRNINPYLEIAGARRTQILANSFRQFKEFHQVNNIATYKRVVQAPDYILQFLESSPGFPYRDSLILFAAAYDPIRMANYLRRSKSALVGIIQQHPNLYVKKIVELAEHRHASEILPFLAPLAEGKLTVEEILKKRLDVTAYFQLLVNTLMDYVNRPDVESAPFVNALRNGIREKALAFYVNRINELHNSPNNVRFAVVNNLRPEDLYYIITSAETELYTSSYLGLYSKLMVYCKKQATDTLFRAMKYDNFRQFVRMAANYNTLADFFGCLPTETSSELMRRFITGIEQNTHTGIEKAMDVADAFNQAATDSVLESLVVEELENNYARTRTKNHFFGMRIYEILLQVYDKVKNGDGGNKVFEHLGDYEKLHHKSLRNENGEVIQLVLFYGDEDGVSSFNNFKSTFSDFTKWEMSESEYWIKYKSMVGAPVIIFANKPLDHEQELDLKAQDMLASHFRQNSIEPVILIHRGHSYHLKYTLRRLQPSMKLAILGSCGGYNNILSVANISPDAHMIASKKIGSKLINDPMIEAINKTLQKNQDIVWAEIWSDLSNRFSKDANTLNLFNEYIPPTRNISLFVLKLFNYPKKVFLEDVVR